MKIKEGIIISTISNTEGGMLFDTVKGAYYRVNETVCFIINKIKECDTYSAKDIAVFLCNEYDVEFDIAIKDSTSIVEEFKELGFIVD